MLSTVYKYVVLGLIDVIMNDLYDETGIFHAVLSITVFALTATLFVVALGIGLTLFGDP